MFLSVPVFLQSAALPHSQWEEKYAHGRKSRASLEFVGISTLAKSPGSYPQGMSQRELGILYHGSFAPLNKITSKTLFQKVGHQSNALFPNQLSVPESYKATCRKNNNALQIHEEPFNEIKIQ